MVFLTYYSDGYIRHVFALSAAYRNN